VALSRGSRWFIGAAMLVVAGIAGGLWWVDENLFADDVEPGQPVEYTVEPGMSVAAVGEELAELGIVRSSTRFRLAAGDAGLASVLQPGVFELETRMETDEVIDVLAAGPIAPLTVRFTVPEGWPVELTLERLDDAFEELTQDDFRAVLDERAEAEGNGDGLLELPDWVPEPADLPEGVDEPFEGLLWPQTYEVEEDASALEILQTMVDQLTREMQAVPEDLVADAEGRGLSRYEVLIVASLVEREARAAEDRGPIAGVISNRLDDGMRLQIDATVLYARGEHTDRVLLEDTEIDSPYNTYQVEGLPPTPIAGTGTAALQAAFDPADVPYFYYVVGPDCGPSHVFAETAEEHSENVAAFREACQ
jgi:UPF0755 protein